MDGKILRKYAKHKKPKISAVLPTFAIAYDITLDYT